MTTVYTKKSQSINIVIATCYHYHYFYVGVSGGEVVSGKVMVREKVRVKVKVRNTVCRAANGRLYVGQVIMILV